MLNSGKYNRKIEIYEKKSNGITDENGYDVVDYVFVKNIFATMEDRTGGLLSGRPADTVLTTCTTKFTWRIKSFPFVQADKHRIKYNNIFYDVNYCIGDEVVDEELQVFVTARV